MAHGDARDWGSEEETGEWSAEPVLFTLSRNMVYPALLPLMPHTSAGQQSTELMPPPGRFKWTGPFGAKDQIWFPRMCHHVSNGRKTKSGFCACAITFETGERPNLVSAHVPSRFKRDKDQIWFLRMWHHVSNAVCVSSSGF